MITLVNLDAPAHQRRTGRVQRDVTGSGHGCTVLPRGSPRDTDDTVDVYVLWLGSGHALEHP